MRKIYLVTMILVLTTSTQAALYRWVDDAGNVHFSDKVPVAASKKSHTKFNKSGNMTSEIDPTLKQDKVKRTIAKKRSTEHNTETHKEITDTQKIIGKRDSYLLSTYDNEQELSRYFENKIKMIKGNTNILKLQNKRLNNKIKQLQRKATLAQDRATLDKITKSIVRMNNSIAQYQKELNINNKQMASLTDNYHTDLLRFKALVK